ncbi:MAG: 2,3-diphosphoglycerate synthetase [Gaiellaceae bacterium]
MRALALIDGEHYAPVVRQALAELPYEFVAALLVGGTEKLREVDDYGVPLATGLEEAIARYEPELVVDLSDEPVLGPRERFRIASRVLALGLPYAGSDFRFEPPALAAFDRPSIGVVGTGKRVGKTALAIQLARLCAKRASVVVVAMGRGGPPEPELCQTPPDLDELIELSRSGRHAASDYLEDAALAGVTTIGARRCGGGFAGTVGVSNVLEAAQLARELDPDLVIFEGSGAALPPVACDRRILVVSAHQDAELAAGYLNAYRILTSDLVVVSFAEPGQALEELRKAIQELRPDMPIVATRMRPRPLVPIQGRRVALFTASPPGAHEMLAGHLSREHGAEVVLVSGNLARRQALREELAHVDAGLFLIELKAAAVEIVAEVARERGIEVALVDNELVPLPGEPALEHSLRVLAEPLLELRVR